MEGHKEKEDVAHGIGSGSSFHHDSVRYDRSWFQQLQDALMLRGTSAYKYEVVGPPCKKSKANFLH